MDYIINGYVVMEYVICFIRTGGMKHCSLTWVCMSTVHQNGALSLVWILQIFSHVKKL